jgi:uncharacterized LabA/DUF88 family protein
MITQKKRVRVYIDAANLIMGARMFDVPYDIAFLLEYFTFKYSATSCVYFTGRIPALAEDYKKITDLGVEIIFKELYSENAKTKANCDVEIAHRITRDIERGEVDAVVLVSGDGDFASLLDYAATKLSTIRLFAIHRKSTSRLLRSRDYLKLIYLTSVANWMQERKRKGSSELNVSAELLFVNSSIN